MQAALPLHFTVVPGNYAAPAGVNLFWGFDMITVYRDEIGVDHNLTAFQGSYPDANAISVNPMLDNTHFHLLAGSPAIDATGAATCVLTQDVDGLALPNLNTVTK